MTNNNHPVNTSVSIFDEVAALVEVLNDMYGETFSDKELESVSSYTERALESLVSAD